MSGQAVRAEGLSKRYRIVPPGAPSWRRRLLSGRSTPRHVDVEALRDVSFTVDEGEVFGIIGRNGAGKSTLLKILSRITSPTSGRAVMHGRVASLLEVGTGFHPELTGRENVYLNGMLLGMPKREVDRVFDEICAFAGIDTYIDTPIKRYSSGMQLRLAFAVAAHLAADTMIVDEVLAVGDAEFQAKCTQAMRSAAGRGRTTLFVSHNMTAVENLCTRALLLQEGRVTRIGPATQVVTDYLRSVSHENVRERVFDPPAGHAPAWIRRVSASAASGGPPQQGEDIVLRATIRVERPVQRLQLHFELSTEEGIRVFAGCNGDYRQEWDLQPGTYTVEIALRSVRLLSRSHRVGFRLGYDWGAEVMHDVPDALSFPVASRDVLGTGVPLLPDRGITWIPFDLELRREG